MPTYEYECKSCGHAFEAFQSMKDEPLKVCPQCGKEIRRLITGGSGIIFKGSGFYATDKQGAAKPASTGKNADKDAVQDTAKKDAGKPETAGTGETAAPPDSGGKSKTETPVEKKEAS